MEKYKRLTVQLSNGKIGCLQEYSQNDLIERLAELEDKIENGTLIEVLFKAGDIVYQLDNGGIIYENEIKSIYYVNNTLFYDCGSFAFDNTAIGEGIYLTKAEAEKKLEE